MGHAHVDAEGRLRRIDLTGGDPGFHVRPQRRARPPARRRRFEPRHARRRQPGPSGLDRGRRARPAVHRRRPHRRPARRDGMRRTWLHTDHVGSLVLVTDASGEVVLPSSSIPTVGCSRATARPWHRKASPPARPPGPTSSCSVLAGTARASAGSSRRIRSSPTRTTRSRGTRTCTPATTRRATSTPRAATSGRSSAWCWRQSRSSH